MFGKKKKKETNDFPEWKRLKSVVDGIFKDTEKERKVMTNHLKEFRGEIWDPSKNKYDGTDIEKSQVVFNMLFSVIESIAPLITDNNPITSVIPRFPFFEKLARRYNHGLKYVWNVIDMQMQSYKNVLWALITGLGIYKVFYDPTKTFGGDMCVEVVDPRDFFLAPGYDEIWKAPMCGVRSLKPMTWIEETFGSIEDITPDEGFGSNDDMRKAYKYGTATSFELASGFATVYEVWLKDNKTTETILVEVPTGEYDNEGEETTTEEKKEQLKYPHGKFVYFTREKFLGCEKIDADHGLPPYVEFVDYINPGDFLGIGEAHQISGLNKELNLQLQAVVDYARRNSDPNYEADVGTGLDPEHIKATKALGGQVYGVDKQMGYKGPAIIPIKEAPVNEAVLNLIMMLPKVIEEVAGVTEVSKGQIGKKERQSASELAILLETSHTRTRQRVRNHEWALKRVSYLFVRLQQQYYTEPRSIHWHEDNNILYSTLGNSMAQAIEAIIPDSQAKELAGRFPTMGQQEKNHIPPEQRQMIEDYLNMIRVFDTEGDLDPILFEFDIAIQTNSTLPLDKQSQANLYLRLAQMKLVDAEAVLEALQVPDREAILERLEKDKQKMKPPSMPPGVPKKANPNNPADVQDFMSRVGGN